MRLHRLEIEGFGPFLARQTVDFDSFAEDGIFLIAGRTGAGKSSILDAVCFGLYGSVPRYESGDKRLRSDHCEPDDPSEVVVEFSTSAGRFRVTRSPEYLRPAKRGGGLTKQSSAVQLDVLRDGAWVTLAAKEKRVADELEEIVQLSREQFLQVILLAQNRFARFLLADSKERQGLLRRLFGTERFEEVQARFDDRRRASEQALAGVVTTVDARVSEAERVVSEAELWGDAGAGPETASTQERIDALRAATSRAEYRVERRGAERDDAEKRLTAADAALTAIREEQKAQQERDRARAEMARLDSEQTEIDRAKSELQRARAAEALRSTLAATARARSARETAQAAEVEARERWDAVGVELAEASAEALEAWAADRTRESGAWARAAELEQTAATLAAELATAREQVAAASALVDAGEAERAELPARLNALRTQRDEVRRNADRIEDRERALNAAASRREAAAAVASVSAQREAAERTLAEASTTLADAQSVLALLRRRRLDGFAGELATSLVPGEPCAVCGSTEHPAPAAHTDPVSADHIDDAEATRDAAQTVERAAQDRVTTLTADLAAASAVADGRTMETADAELATAERAHAEAVAAAGELAALEAQVEQATQAIAALEQRRTDAAATLAAARETLAVIVQREQEAATQITEARGEFDTVADRVASVVAQASTAHALATAISERTRAEEAYTAASQEQVAALVASDFDGVAAASDAMRSASEQEVLDARITAHRVQREKERSTLLQLELRTLPEEPIDLVPAETASGEARTVWKTAMDAAGRAESVAAQLDRLVESAASEHARSAERQAEHEVLRGLADTIAGRAGNTHKMTLETFVLAAELEEIVEAANRRLSDMSTGRYQLQHSDALAARGAASGLGIVVFDAFTGQTRPAQSLSGGETFLSSLALALGLAEVVTARAGGIRLDTLFIDEGFGSLDADTLEVAMRTLDELRSGGRTVGIISHVESMQEQIPAQLVVEQTPAGPSRIRC
ncbi:SMC family ATPase [Microbacterium sp. Bi121]|uniref:AAA family ATPase n=1 Tax=Microbacterium sp. Bi121 TaxID=2822348 RepID=UPI001E19DF14|nr:SMC family ATPase [Microbacterium sp. Bi121]CAH0122949.1 Nuclease SbcCD subunit C [Microbacterium sp. Bi121]